MQKVYLINIYNPDNNDFDQLFGIYDSKSAYLKDIENLEQELQLKKESLEYEVSELSLNKSILFSDQIMK